jgi:hypothetical protein
MGFYHGTTPEPEERPPGCMDVVVITRAVFSVLFWPMLAIFVAVLDLALIFYTFAVHPALALLPLGLTAAGIALFARWDQRRNSPDDV